MLWVYNHYNYFHSWSAGICVGAMKMPITLKNSVIVIQCREVMSFSNILLYTIHSAVQRKTAVAASFPSKQLLLSAFVLLFKLAVTAVCLCMREYAC